MRSLKCFSTDIGVYSDILSTVGYTGLQVGVLNIRGGHPHLKNLTKSQYLKVIGKKSAKNVLVPVK